MTGPHASGGRRPSLSTYPALFLITLATLMYETALTRIFSVTMWYHFAFVAISVALFGMTVGALIVHLRPERFRDEVLTRKLWFHSLAFAVAIPVALLTQLAIPFEPHLNATGLWSVTLTCIIISVPFIFSGIVVSLMLTRFPLRVNRLYAADLIGAALGCIALVVAFRWLDGPSLVIATGAIAAVAALVFAVGGLGRRQIVGAAAAAVLIGGFAFGNAIALTHHHAVVKILFAKDATEATPIYEKWNSFSRVTVTGFPNALQSPSSAGFSVNMPSFQVHQLAMVIDSTAGTVMTGYNGDPATTRFLRYDLSNLAYNLRHGGSAAIIGVGGGRDVLSALQFGDRSVTGIEINKNILDMVNHRYGAFTGHLDRDPRVHFVNDEARSWLTRTKQRFDTIQISLIDTWAASGAGAYALSENNLYTTQAWAMFLNRLHPHGILSITRWYKLPNSNEPVEILRTASLASQALINRGVKNPRSHLLIYAGPPTGPLGSVSAATVLVSPQPFSPIDIARMNAVTARLGFAPVLTPTEAPVKQFEVLTGPGGPKKVAGQFDFDVSPPTDNKPFFFQMASLRTLLAHPKPTDSLNIQPVQTLAVLGFAVLVLALICVLLPFLLDREGRGGRVDDRRFRSFYVFFAAIGFGFLFIEVTMLQWLSIFLGSPVYSLVVVLFSLLLFSGIGSAATERIIRGKSRVSLVGPLVAVVVVVTTVGILTPSVIHGAAAYTTPSRILVSLALLAPLGLTMGMPFAIGMHTAGQLNDAPTAFMWAINGATSVCASVFAVVFAVFFGIQQSYFAGVVAYVIAMGAMVAIARRPVTEEEPIRVPAAEPDLATLGGS